MLLSIGGNLNIKPTEAFKIEDKEKHVVFPALAQPKADGVRCIAILKDGRARLYSKVGNLISVLPHIEREIEKTYSEDIILDGELYNHKFKHDFNAIISRVKRKEIHEDHKSIELHIFDIATEGNYKARISKAIYGEYLKQVESIEVNSREELEQRFSEFKARDYEGAMYRNHAYEYEYKRTVALLKMKDWHDAEYEVVDVIEGKGKLIGKAGSMRFKHESGGTFKAGPIGEYPLLQHYLENKEFYIGKMMTVKYQNMTPAGIPRFGKVLRLREDI